MSASDNVEISLFPSKPTYSDRDAQDESRVIQMIRDQILPQRQAEYFQAKARIKRSYDATPEYVVVYLLRKDIYSAEVLKVEVNETFEVTNVVENYSDDEDDDSEDHSQGEDYDDDVYALDPDIIFVGDEEDYAYDFVVATPVPQIPTAKDAVDTIFDLAKKHGYKPIKLLGAAASVANYKMYLKSGVKAFVNIGHGSPSGIVLSDGPLTASWLNTLSGKPLAPGVIYFNSCKVFNNPLKTAVMNAGARTYIGGITNLLIGPSEKVCTCFWTKAIKQNVAMKPALQKCELDNYPNQGAHGIMGDIGLFRKLNLKLAHAMWAHGHSMEVQFPDRLAYLRRYGYFGQAKGKPFMSNWLHFAIPTPTIVDAERLIVGSVILRYRLGPGATIDAVHVWDGERRIAVHNNLNLPSTAGFAWRRFDVPSHPYIRYGLGISIYVKFGDSANLPANRRLLVEISSVGCEFMEKIRPVIMPPIAEPIAIERPDIVTTTPIERINGFDEETPEMVAEDEGEMQPSLN